MAEYSNKIIAVVIALLLAGILLPIGLEDLVGFTSTNATIQTLVSEVLPIMAVIGIVLMFVVKRKE